MISSEVQRTLVKSPPELWAELSDPEALARHLGELGDIRIVRVEPETSVEWEAESISGTVTIKPSGWGTKVTLSATRQPAAGLESAGDGEAGDGDGDGDDSEAGDASAKANAEATGAAETSTDPASAEAPSAQAPRREASSAGAAGAPRPNAPAPEAMTHALDHETGTQEKPAQTLEAEPVEQARYEVEHAKREGFFSRLFRRRRKHDAAGEPATTATASEAAALVPTSNAELSGKPATPVTPSETASDTRSDEDATARAEPASTGADAFEAVSAALAPDTIAVSGAFYLHVESRAGQPTGKSEGGSHASTDISAELRAAEEVPATAVTAEQVTAVLTAVLDRLGAAHHRPFSRA